MECHYIWKRHAPQVVIPHQHDLQRFSEGRNLASVEARQTRMRRLRGYVTFIRIPSEIRDKRNCRRIFIYDAPAVLLLRRKNVVKEDTPGSSKVIARSDSLGL